MKKLIIVGIIVIVAMFLGPKIIDIINGGGDGNKEDVETQLQRSATIYNVNSVKPTFTNAYIDASGSMKGYFSNQADARFTTALANARPDKTMWMNPELTELVGIPTNTLLTHKFRGGDSRFDKMLGKIIKNDSLQKSGGISLLFTDGILSASVNETNRNLEYMRNSYQYFINHIADTIRKNEMAIAMYKLESKYYGTYWDYQNKSVPNVAIADRPFYVIAIGKPAQIRHFIANNKLGAKVSIVFGDYGKDETDTTKYIFYPAVDNDWNNADFIGKELELNLTLPEYIANKGKDSLKQNLIIEFDQKDVTSQLKSCCLIQGSNLKITKWSKEDLSKPMLTYGSHELTIKVKEKNSLEDWKKLSCDDDKNIKTNLDEQQRTFFLEHLLKGLQEGTQEPDEQVIFSSTIKFNIQ